MKLDRSLCSLDIEATGKDPQTDRIVELAMVVLYPDGNKLQRVSRFHPGIPIPPEATAVHHITDEMVAGCPAFKDLAGGIHKAIQGRDLMGYNLRSFDLPILDAEFRRCGLKLDLSGVHVIDCFSIYQKKDPRDLAAAVRKYCHRDHVGAHGALADAAATVDVLQGQLAEYGDLAGMSVADLAAFSMRDADRQPADLGGKLYFKSGVLHYGFGQHRDKPVESDIGYARWMLGKDFPESTCEVLREELLRIESATRAPDSGQRPYQATDADVPF